MYTYCPILPQRRDDLLISRKFACAASKPENHLIVLGLECGQICHELFIYSAMIIFSMITYLLVKLKPLRQTTYLINVLLNTFHLFRHEFVQRSWQITDQLANRIFTIFGIEFISTPLSFCSSVCLLLLLHLAPALR